MIFFQRFYLDREKDIVVELYMEGERLYHVIRTPNHHTGNLISNLARLCGLETVEDENGLKVIRGEVPCYIDGDNRRIGCLTANKQTRARKRRWERYFFVNI